MKSDSQLQADVLEELRHDQCLVPSDIGVSAKDGVISLYGQVDSLVKRTAAARATERVHGVRAIANEIVVRLSIEDARSDADIAHDAVHALMWDTEVPDKTIKVRVQDRWIWLIGDAEFHYERVAAERAVERIRGVKGVTNLVRLKPSVPPGDLRERIEAALAREARLAARPITVAVRDGNVVLDGRVASWSERMAAEHCAWSARGVRGVNNNLVVAPI